MEPARDDQHPAGLLGHRRGHGRLAGGTAIKLEHRRAVIAAGQCAVAEHVLKKPGCLAAVVIQLVELVPEVVRIAGPDPAACLAQHRAVRQVLLLEQAQRSSTVVMTAAFHHLWKRQVDKPRPGADRRRGPDRGQLGRVVAKRIVGRMPQRIAVLSRASAPASAVLRWTYVV